MFCNFQVKVQIMKIYVFLKEQIMFWISAPTQ